LFILVADVLQVLIRKSQQIRHPIVENAGCPVLQYADDTLLLVRGELEDVQSLRLMLDQFASATGLQINYSKSTAVPIHMNEEECRNASPLWAVDEKAFHRHILAYQYQTPS
jgi:hypothetical protein